MLNYDTASIVLTKLKKSFIPMIDKVIENVCKIAPDKFSNDTNERGKINTPADSGYCSGKNLTELEETKFFQPIQIKR